MGGVLLNFQCLPYLAISACVCVRGKGGAVELNSIKLSKEEIANMKVY